MSGLDVKMPGGGVVIFELSTQLTLSINVKRELTSPQETECRYKVVYARRTMLAIDNL